MSEIKKEKESFFNDYKVEIEKVFNEHKNEIKWEEVEWEKLFVEEVCDDFDEFIEKYGIKNNDTLTKLLSDLKNKYQNQKTKFVKEIKQSSLENLKKLLDDYIVKNKNLEFLRGNRALTEKIVPEIIQDFDSVKIKEGSIYIVVSLPLGPFFKGKFEQEFQELRLIGDWKEFIGYDEKEEKIKWPLYQNQNGIFISDQIERELEKTCYDIKAFRGITYNEILTPIYKLDKENQKNQITKLFDKIENKHVPKAFEEEKRKLSKKLSGDELKEASKTLESKEAFIKKVFGKIRNTLLEEEKWDIKVRLTKGGLVNIFFEKDFFSADFYQKEFKETSYTIENLYKAIDAHQYDIDLQAPYNTVDWLNELLKVPDFYDKLKPKINASKLSDNIILLVKKTDKYRKENFSELNDDQKSNIKRLNRRLLEEIYPDNTPKSQYDIKDLANEKRRLMTNPYLDEELLCNNDVLRNFSEENKLLKKEQIFTSYLNAAAIWITHIFLRECKVYKKVADILRIDKKRDWTDCLEYPWNVMYKAPPRCKTQKTQEDVSTHDTPPLRNYFFVFHLKDVKGIGWGDKIITSEEHFDCPADVRWCPKKEGDNCFITLFGHSLLALSTNTYVVRDNDLTRPWFTQKELENFAKRDLSRWRGELCFIDSETILICSSSMIAMINKEGQEVEYDTYWKSIIKGLSLLVSCKTLAMDISRLLFDCIGQYREKEKVNKEKEILERLKIISHLLSRARFIATPSNISRARYVREKLEVYIKAIGLPEIINNIEKDYDELNKAIQSSIESKTNERILCLTFLMVPLTIVATVGTVILVFIEDDCENYFFGTILTIGIAIFIFLIFLYYFLEKGKKISRLFKRFQKIYFCI